MWLAVRSHRKLWCSWRFVVLHVACDIVPVEKKNALVLFSYQILKLHYNLQLRPFLRHEGAGGLTQLIKPINCLKWW